MSTTNKIIARNQDANRKHFAPCEVEVMEVIEAAPGTYTLTLALDGDFDSDLADLMDTSLVDHMPFIDQPGVYFPAGAGIGVPPPTSSPEIDRIFAALAMPANAEDKNWLAPHAGYAGPDLSTPSTDLLRLILSRADKHVDKTALLWMAVQDETTLYELQSTYDVADLLEHFPGLITAEELWDVQPQGAMNRTFTILPAAESSIKYNRPCFAISVRLQKSKAPQRLLGENPIVIRDHGGVNSTQLCALKAGDKLVINNRIKGSKASAHPYDPARDIVYITQGNAYERCLSYLYEKQQHPAKDKASFTLIAGFKYSADIPVNGDFEKLMNDGSLTAIHHALSREETPPASAQPSTYYHAKKHVGGALATLDISAMNNPVFFIAGSNAFCDAVSKNIQDIAGENADIRKSGSAERLRRPAVNYTETPAPATSLTKEEIEAYKNKHKNETCCGGHCSSPQPKP
jgi:NAD(P)H-flavin reductase